MKKRYLVLEDGSVFTGEAFGADACAVGELVFTTGMGGYLETLTDPSFYGQIVLHTFPLIGNYGVIPEDFEGECRLKGYVVGELCDFPSNFRSQGKLDDFLKQKGIPGVAGVDTREITRIIRERGVMNAILCDDIPADLTEVKAYQVKNAVPSVTHEGNIVFPVDQKKFTVAMLDYGAKRNIVRELNKRGCEVVSLPASTSAEEVLSLAVDGVMLSNGPGDPAENAECIAQLQKLLGKIPMFGICLGHQLLALADGATAVKMKYGHRGENQPAREVDGSRTYVTSQNHGYAIFCDAMNNGVVRFVNANDGTCEGITYPHQWAFTVQFHPEAAAGPRDTAFLFDEFVALMEEHKQAAKRVDDKEKKQAAKRIADGGKKNAARSID